MTEQSTPTERKSTSEAEPKLFTQSALFLQGGGALGAYEAGVYEALEEVGIHPDIVGGVSIGGINGAIIASHAPEGRVAALRKFWNEITREIKRSTKAYTDKQHKAADAASANETATKGVHGLSSARPRLQIGHAWLAEQQSMGTGISVLDIMYKVLNKLMDPPPLSYHTADEQSDFLRKHIDFEALNAKKWGVKEFAVAVSNKSNKTTFFDIGEKKTIGQEHIRASAAILPHLPMVEIEGEYYFDGGNTSNNPRVWAVKKGILTPDTISFKVHLFSPKEKIPKTREELAKQLKLMESRDRGEDVEGEISTKAELTQAYDALDEADQRGAKGNLIKALMHKADNGPVIDIRYNPPAYALGTNEADFAQSSMKARWNAGYENTIVAICRSGLLDRFSDEVLERLAPHIFKECPDVITTLSPRVLNIICSKKVLQNPNNLRNPAIPPIDNEYMEIPEQRGMNINDALVALMSLPEGMISMDTKNIKTQQDAKTLQEIARRINILVAAGLLENVSPDFRPKLEERLREIAGMKEADGEISVKEQEKSNLRSRAQILLERNKTREEKCGTTRTLF